MLTMLAAALLGGQVFAADPTGTAIDGAAEVSNSKYYGAYATGENVATGGKVTIKKDPSGQVPDTAEVYGGRSENAGAFNNTVIMSGGTVRNIRGGDGKNGEVSNNVVIVTGGSSTSTVYGAYGSSGTWSDNRVHLLGKGANNVTIADGQGITSTYSYTGEENGISLQNLVAAAGSSVISSTGNTIDIYGSGIKLSGSMGGMQILTFNITNEQMTEQATEAALTHTSASFALNLTGVALQIKDLDVKDWATGKTITLVQSEQEIKGAAEELPVGKEVEIKRGEVVTATATLKLGDDKKSLILTNIQGKNVPEPATGTLSLLALATLAARRRRK